MTGRLLDGVGGFRGVILDVGAEVASSRTAATLSDVRSVLAEIAGGACPLTHEAVAQRLPGKVGAHLGEDRVPTSPESAGQSSQRRQGNPHSRMPHERRHEPGEGGKHV